MVALTDAGAIIGLQASFIPGDEYHLVFECRGLQHIRDRYPGLFGHHAGTMIQYMWQADLHGFAKFVTDCLAIYYDTNLGHLISPRWLEEM